MLTGVAELIKYPSLQALGVFPSVSQDKTPSSTPVQGVQAPYPYPSVCGVV